MLKYKTYNYRLNPTPEQQERITELLDEKDRAFNELVTCINDGFACGKSTDDIIPEITAKLPYEPYKNHLKKEVEGLLVKKEKGRIIHIKPCAAYRRKRSIGFTLPTVREGKVLLPRVGWVRMVFHRPFPEGATVYSVIVSEEEYRRVYSVSFRLKFDSAEAVTSEVHSDQVLGLDYKQDGLYVDSNGQSGGYPGFLQQGGRRVADLYQKSNRFAVGSRRWLKLRKRAAKLEAHIVRQRKDWQNKKATHLADTNDAVCIECLDPVEMQRRNAKLAPKMRDNNWQGFRRTLESKLSEKGKPLIEVSKYFPSSQICSSCGFRFGKRDLNVRTITCPNCGAVFDRDINAACNIRNEGLRLLRAS